MGRFISVN
jgi:hypothetical protein